jgi:hypothetical protein
MSEPREATDVLISVENKLDTLLGLVRSHDLNLKILSNKINEMMNKMNEQPPPPKIIVETVQTAPKPSMPPTFTALPVDPERNIPIVAEHVIPQTDSPQGFRRNSRPETYANEKDEVQLPIQIPPAVINQQVKAPPGRSVSDVLVSPKPAPQQSIRSEPITMIEQPEPASIQGQIPVVQRCVDKNQKSIFLAEVEVINLESKDIVHKTRTNATGKWSGVFGNGKYRAIIRKRESLTKEKIEKTYDFQVDGTLSRLDLPVLIIT